MSGKSDKLELKPCPFCGGRADLHSKDSPTSVSYVECTMCGVQLGGLNDAEAVNRWNNRQKRSDAREPKRWKEYFCLSPMVESDKMICIETLERICEALGSEFMVCYDDRGGIGFGRLEEKGEGNGVQSAS